jgi:hypothetical protein
MPYHPQVLRWGELHHAPPGPGIYSWYYTPTITDFDLQQAISEIHSRKEAGDTAGALSTVKELLRSQVLAYFRQDDYSISLVGPLKAPHYGAAVHHQEPSESLIRRIADDPERLYPLREVLRATTPYFASPLYVGMSDSLKGRLQTHKLLIQKLRDAGLSATDISTAQPEDAGFARRIVARRIPPDHLIVAYCEIPAVHPDLHTDAENLLNRMFYPVLGRN